MSEDITKAEATNLRVHVELCGQRYDRTQRHLQRIERTLWGLIGVLTAGGYLTLEKLGPLARIALAVTP
jgi:hypothetical protein